MHFNIKSKTLENQLKLHYIYAPSDDISIIASVNAGRLYETKEEAGISHLIEHCLFKGTTKRASRDKIYSEMGTLGHKNFCYTHYLNVPLGFRVINTDFEQTVELIADLYFNSLLDEKETMKEKEIVLDEIRNGNDNPNNLIQRAFDKTCFPNSPIGRPTIGYVNGVKGFNIEKIQEFYHETFNPANTSIYVVGPRSFEEISDLIATHFQKEGYNQKREIIPHKIPPNKKRITKVEKDLDNIHWMMGHIFPDQKEESFALKIAMSALSRLISQKILNENPISYSRWCTNYNILNTSMNLAYAAFEPKNLTLVRKLVKEEWEKVSIGEIPEEHILKNIKSRKNALILGNATTMNKAKNLMAYDLNGEITEINTIFQSYEKVTSEEVRTAAKTYLSSENLTEIIVGKGTQHL